jgi:hypothetical protein
VGFDRVQDLVAMATREQVIGRERERERERERAEDEGETLVAIERVECRDARDAKQLKENRWT